MRIPERLMSTTVPANSAFFGDSGYRRQLSCNWNRRVRRRSMGKVEEA